MSRKDNSWGTLSEESLAGKLYDTKLLKRIFFYVRPYMHFLWVSLLLVFIVSGVILVRPYIIKVVIDNHLLGDGDFMKIMELVGLYLALVIIGFVASYLETYLLNYTSQKIMYDIREAVFTHLQKLSLSFFDRNPIGRLVTRVANDTANLNEMFTEVMIGLVKDIVLIVGILIVMLTLDLRLALLSFLSIPLILLATNIYRKAAQKSYRLARVKLAALNSILQENLVGMRIVQIFNRQDKQFADFERINHEHYNAEMGALRAHALFRPSMDIIYFAVIILLLWHGSAEAIQGVLPLGVLYAFINYTERLFNPINDMTQKYAQLQSGIVASERIFLLLDEKEEIKDPESSHLPKGRGDFKGNIVFDKVWFAYEDENWVLKDVSFEIRPGDTVAFVGPTGSGKTTIINLLTRLYDVQRGEIRIDGQPIKEYKQAELRRHIGIVMQDVFLFSSDIESNISLENSFVTPEKARKAACLIGAEPFIGRLPNGYHTAVSERGSTLSTGQRQLLSFARALAIEPKVLILDEATSNVDSQSEALIQEAMHNLSAKHTSIIIAHRLSTIQHADTIFVFQKGRIVEQGNHQALLKQKGLYYRLYRLQ